MQEHVDRAPVPVPSPLIFVGYLAAALLLNWSLPLSLPSPLILLLLGVLALVGGAALDGAAFSQMVKRGTTIDPHGSTTVLVGGGPYRLTRNPIYLGFFLIFLGLTLVAGTFWGLILIPFLLWTATRVIIQPEEADLAAKFNGAYADYASRVRRWL